MTKGLAIFALCWALLATPALSERSLLQASAPLAGPASAIGVPTTSAALAPSTTGAGPTDVDVLNFALNLEYLEAEFYACATTGQPIPANLRGGGPPSTGCQAATLSNAVLPFAKEIAKNELQHVVDLRTALGSAAVPIPQLNIGTVWSDLANAAANANVSPAFSPYINDLSFLLAVFVFEDVGCTAYEGGVGVLTTPSNVQTAAKVAAVEAYQAGIVRTWLYLTQSPSKTAWPYPPSITDLTTAISNLRNMADGPPDDDQGIITNGALTLTPVDQNALVFARTPQQVVSIVTLGKGPSGGGFFPNGLNGFFGAPTNAG